MLLKLVMATQGFVFPLEEDYELTKFLNQWSKSTPHEEEDEETYGNEEEEEETDSGSRESRYREKDIFDDDGIPVRDLF